MNNPNPFVPKGSLMEQQSLRRSRLKIGVSCVLAVAIVGLVGMLIQGCKREQPKDDSLDNADTNNAPIVADTNTPPVDTNATAIIPPLTNTPPVVIPPVVVPPPVVEASGTEYIVVAGDTLGKIARHNHVLLKDLEAANPGVDPKHLKVKQKLTIPASTQAAPADSGATTTSGATDATGGQLYTIKSGDTLAKIARANHTTVKAIQAENNLTTTRILVGHKLKIPASADATSAPAPVAPVEPAPAPAPAAPPLVAPEPAPTTGK